MQIAIDDTGLQYANRKMAKTNTNCMPVPNQNRRSTSPNFIRNGIKYLNSVTNFCTVWAKSCSRVSCSYVSLPTQLLLRQTFNQLTLG